MEIKWKEGGGVQILDMTPQEWAWLRRELGRAQVPVTRDAGDGFIEQIRTAVPINANEGTKQPDLSTPVL